MSIPEIWIDTDTGVDDALALMCAAALAKQGRIALAGVSSVCGNVEQEKTFENARNVLFLTGKEDIPVYPGAAAPLKRPLKTAKHVHGDNGLGGALIRSSCAERLTKPAWDAVYECAKSREGELELILVGPQTNAAIAFRKYPDLGKYLKRILIMGGSLEGGNITPYAEFNIYADPEAAKEVLSQDVPIVMFGLEATMKAMLTREDIDEIEAGENACCTLFREATAVAQGFYQRSVGDCYCCHDVCPVLFPVYPDLFRGINTGIDVVTEGERLGQTAGRTETENARKNVRVMTETDRTRFAEIVKALLLEKA